MKVRINLVRWRQFHTSPNLTTNLYHTQSTPTSNPNPINTELKQLVQNGQFLQALERYTTLWNTGFRPDNFTFPHILKASTKLHNQTMGFLIHNIGIKTGYASDLFFVNSLIQFYGGFQDIQSIHYLFDEMPERNIVTWTAVISAFSLNKQSHHAIGCFREMRITGVEPNSFTIATLLPNFSYNQGSFQIHSFLIKQGFISDVIISTALVDLYAKCGHILPARKVFNEIPDKNIVSWNTMILGYNLNGYARAPLRLFARMWSSSHIQPDSFSVVGALNSCATLTSLKIGEEIHCYIHKVGLEGSHFVENALLDMYGKCGALKLAEKVFGAMHKRDVSSWTTLITCYGLHGDGIKAIATFEEMKQTRYITPNSVTMIAVLTACRHSCLVKEGLKYFEEMTNEFGIEPSMKHYACIVDLLGRAGFLLEALNFINKMPIQGDVPIWESLLGAATIQGDKAVIKIAADNLLELQSENPEVYVQLANMYANFGWWEEVAKIRDMAPIKKPGLSYV